MTSVAEAILHEIHRDGYSVGEHQQVDRATGETWTVNAPTAYQAAFELARQIGWGFEE